MRRSFYIHVVTMFKRHPNVFLLQGMSTKELRKAAAYAFATWLF